MVRVLSVFSDDGCLEPGCALFYCLADARQVYILTDLQIDVLIRISEWQHAPVYAVAAITLGCILNTDIRQAAQYLLAASSILTGRTITRPFCV